jgi:hypothetical protein
MWDEQSMTDELIAAGFVDIRRCELGDAGDPMFDRVEDPNRFFECPARRESCKSSIGSWRIEDSSEGRAR